MPIKTAGFANPAFFAHYYLFAWGRSALPLLPSLISIVFNSNFHWSDPWDSDRALKERHGKAF